jgi:glycosyltransferase involved in cell wall biosynthesis
MNILYLNNYNYLRGGSERVFLEEARLMEQNGNNVCIFARRHPNNLPSQYEKYFPRDMVTDSLKPSIDVLRSLSQLFYSREAKKGLASMLQGIRVDVAHAHNVYYRLTTSVLDLLRQRDVPVVMTLHDYKLLCPTYKFLSHGRICEDCKGHLFHMAIKNKCHKESFIASTIYAFESYLNQFFKKYQKSVKFFISPSLFLKNKFLQFGWPEERMIYVPNFINPSEFEPLYSPGKYFLYIGRISSEKGPTTLIQAFMKLSMKKAKLTVVGEAPLMSRLKFMAENYPLIQFLGYLSGNLVNEITRNARAVIVPSICYENAPLSILESFACGKPVIASRIGGIPEMIDDGVNGFLFEPGNEDDLREKLELILSMPDPQISEMGQAARQKVEKEYNAELHYERLMAVYHRALSET